MKLLTLEEAIKAIEDCKIVEYSAEGSGWQHLSVGQVRQEHWSVWDVAQMSFRLRPEPKVPMRVEDEGGVFETVENEASLGSMPELYPFTGKRVRVSVEEIE